MTNRYPRVETQAPIGNEDSSEFSESEINELARSVARDISDQLKKTPSYTHAVSVEVPQLRGINPASLRTHTWPSFILNVGFATDDHGSHGRILHLKPFKLEVGDDGVYTGKATGRLIDDGRNL